MVRFSIWGAVLIGLSMAAAPVAQEAPLPARETLRLEHALALTLLHNPDLQAFAWDIRAAEARMLQARLRPNPELGIEVEDIRLSPGPGTNTRTRAFSSAFSVAPNPLTGLPGLMGDPSASVERGEQEGARSGLAESEITLSLSQEFEVGGKRRNRIAVAEKDRDVAAMEYEVRRLDVLSGMTRAFLDVMEAQEKLALAKRSYALAEEMRGVFAKRVDAGEISPIELKRADVSRGEARLELDDAEHELTSARVELAAYWGELEPTFDAVVGDWHDHGEPPPLETFETQVEQNPSVRKWIAEREKRDAVVRLARSQRVPNPTVTASIRFNGQPARNGSARAFNSSPGVEQIFTSSDPDDDYETRFVLGFSIPLPIFDRNQGNIEEAEIRAQQIDDESEASVLSVRRQLHRAYAEYVAAYHHIGIIENDVLPAAEDTFRLTQRGYEEGKFGYMELLDAQGTLFDVRERLLQSLTEYHRARLETERLIGQPLDAAMNLMDTSDSKEGRE